MPATASTPAATLYTAAPDEAALLRIIGPVTPAVFFDRYFEKETLYVSRSGESPYEDILTVAELNGFLNGPQVKSPVVNLYKAGEKVALASYTDEYRGESGAYHRVDLSRAFSRFNEGATIVVNGAETLFNNLSGFCLSLGALLRAPVQANVYVTPPGSQGFSAHFDYHDVFVLQIAGTKRWRLYDAGLEPLPAHSGGKQVLGDLRLREEVALETGDLLYMPRGVVHEAVTTDTVSVHVTIGLSGLITWADFLPRALDELRKHPNFRKAVPLHSAGDYVRQLPAVLGELCHLLEHGTDWLAHFHEVDEVQTQTALRTRARLAGNYLDSYLRAEGIGPASALRTNAHVLQSVTEDDEQIVLNFYDKKLELPVFLKEAVQFLLTHPQFRVVELPGDLDEESQVMLARHLIREGLLSVRE